MSVVLPKQGILFIPAVYKIYECAYNYGVKMLNTQLFLKIELGTLDPGNQDPNLLWTLINYYQNILSIVKEC